MFNSTQILAAVVTCFSFCFVAQAETVWWDHQFDGTTTPSSGHVSLGHSSVPADDAIVNCPSCIGGKYFSMRGLQKWSYGLIHSTTPDPNTDGDNNPQTNAPAWNKAAGYWPRPDDIGCPGQSGGASNFGESGWYIAATGYGNPGCFPGGATIEIRYKWTCENGRGQCDVEVDDNSEGGMPLMYPSMQYQGLMRTDNARGDYIQFATWGNRPEVDIGDDWVVVRMVVKSSWEGMDYYVHDDGSLEPGTSNNRGADWQDAAGNNQFGRDETERVLTFASNNPYPTSAPEQNNMGWKGFETGGGNDYPTIFGGGNATFDVDYMRWAFDKKIAPTIIPEPATMAMVGLGGLLLLKRRRQQSS